MSNNNIITVDLLFDQKTIDQGFTNIIENKMKAIDLKGLTKAISEQPVNSEFYLQNKTIESNFKRYIEHLLGDNEEGITDISLKFPEEYKMEVYFS